MSLKSNLYFSSSTGNSKSFIKIDDISPKGEISKDSDLSAKITSTSTYTDASMKAIVDVVVKKDSWFGMITVPGWVMRIIAPIVASQIPGVKYVSGRYGNKFSNRKKKFKYHRDVNSR